MTRKDVMGSSRVWEGIGEGEWRYRQRWLLGNRSSNLEEYLWMLFFKKKIDRISIQFPVSPQSHLSVPKFFYHLNKISELTQFSWLMSPPQKKLTPKAENLLVRLFCVWSALLFRNTSDLGLGGFFGLNITLVSSCISSSNNLESEDTDSCLLTVSRSRPSPQPLHTARQSGGTRNKQFINTG